MKLLVISPPVIGPKHIYCFLKAIESRMFVVGRGCCRTGRVLVVSDGCQLSRDFVPGGTSLFPDLVADAPQDHGRVVTVKPDLRPPVDLVPIGKTTVIIVGTF